ncbi:ankyrin repeat-containing domain protein [Aspergillus alliaceus]|uniref:Ankyrin repeat-containing domain protein n=1 Tax=Petromyces alliaceus TaxID=209559 RepID=A0A5N7C5K6_PETAA|nr:ankyrin repeat-containing domain protein [Aspergillus alliaceus]
MPQNGQPRVPVPDYSIDGYTLEEAIMQSNAVLAAQLISRGANVNETDARGKTLLMLAASVGNESVIKLLLQKGAKINAADHNGRTALHRAYIDDITTRTLVDHGAQVDKQDNDGKTALHLAVDDDERGVVHILLQEGADPDRKDRKGRTPRGLAKKYGNKKILRLIEAFDDDDDDD